MSVLQAIRWGARITATGLFLFALPFYLGYGLPIPFINPDHSAHDNAWLCAFPLILSGLVVGWFYEKVGGYLIVVPIVVAQFVTLWVHGEFIPHMFVPLIIGVMYLIAGYGNRTGTNGILAVGRCRQTSAF